MNLPAKEMKKGEVQLNGSLEAMPETRPAQVGRTVFLAPSTNVSVGIGNGSIFSTRLWGSEQNFGASFNAHLAINFWDRKSRIYLSPRIGVVMDGWDSGSGYGLSITYHYTLKDKFGLYTGVGVFAGRYASNKAGSGITSNTGFSYSPTNEIYINAEIIPILQHNTYEEQSHFIVSGSLSIGYTFRRNRD